MIQISNLHFGYGEEEILRGIWTGLLSKRSPLDSLRGAYGSTG